MTTTTNGTKAPGPGGTVELGAVTLDVQRLTVDELDRLSVALRDQARRRQALQNAQERGSG